jgi:hypothetical protein
VQVEGEVLETLPDSLQEFFAQNPLVSIPRHKIIFEFFVAQWVAIDPNNMTAGLIISYRFPEGYQIFQKSFCSGLACKTSHKINKYGEFFLCLQTFVRV